MLIRHLTAVAPLSGFDSVFTLCVKRRGRARGDDISEQLLLRRLCGCFCTQGFYFSRNPCDKNRINVIKSVVLLMSPPRDHAMQCRPMKHARVERGLNERHCLLSTVVVDANDPLTLLANDSFISVVSDSVEIADQSSEPRRQSGAKNGPVILQSTQRIDFACAEASNEDGKSIALDSSRVVVKSEEHTIVDDVNITQVRQR